MTFSHPAQGLSAKLSRLGKARSFTALSYSVRVTSMVALGATSIVVSSLSVASSPETSAAPITMEEMQQRLWALEAKKEAEKPLPAELFGLVELELNQSHLDELRKPNGESNAAGDLTLATVALGVDLDLSAGLTAHVHVLYEQDATPLDVDEAYLTQTSDEWDVAITAGQMYLPFGQFHQHLVNDTLIQTFTETRATALLVNGFNQGPLQLNGYVFKGHNDSSVETYGARMQWQNEQFTVSVDYLSDVMQSDGVQTWLDESSLLDSRLASVSAVNTFALWQTEFAGINLELSWEQLNTSMNAQNPLQAQGKDMSATHGQMAMTWMNQSPATVSVSHQRTQNTQALGLPDERLSVGVSNELNNKIGVAFEWWLDHFNKNDTGTDANATRVQSVALLLSRGF